VRARWCVCCDAAVAGEVWTKVVCVLMCVCVGGGGEEDYSMQVRRVQRGAGHRPSCRGWGGCEACQSWR
jgi:hypothetical protein